MSDGVDIDDALQLADEIRNPHKYVSPGPALGFAEERFMLQAVLASYSYLLSRWRASDDANGEVAEISSAMQAGRDALVDLLRNVSKKHATADGEDR